MTINKPEVLGYCVKRDRGRWERSNNYYLSPNPDENYTVPVISLSDYESLQAELERERQRRFDGNEMASREHREDVAGLVEALDGAARSLETISRQAGIDEYMRDFLEVRGYARNRALVALEDLAAYRKGDASPDRSCLFANLRAATRGPAALAKE